MRSYDVTVFESPLEVCDRPTPEPTGAETLVRVTAAGVCHSDLHICDGFYDLGGGRKLRMADRGVATPITMGHEIAGVIEAVGPQANGARVGEAVVVYPWIGCGRCAACRRGAENLCVKPGFIGIFRRGGYATHCLVPDERYCLPIGAMDPAAAAPFACSGLTTYSALITFDRATLQTQPLVIIGAGGLGLMALSLIKALGGHGAIVVDVDPVKRAAALQAGAQAAFDPATPDVATHIRTLTPEGAGAAAILDLVGAGETVQLAIECAARGGHIVVVGLIGGAIALSIPLLPQRALTLQGSYVGSPGAFRDLMALVAQGTVAPVPTQRRPLAAVQSALDDLRRGAVVGRIVLTPS